MHAFGQQFKKLDDHIVTALLMIVQDAQADFYFRFHWMFFDRAVGGLIEEFSAKQGNAEDLVHLTLPSVEEASFDPMTPRLRFFAKTSFDVVGLVLDRLRMIPMPSLMFDDARRTLIHDTAKRCVLSQGAHPLRDVDDVTASHFFSLCQTFRALLALASDDLDDITIVFDDFGGPAGSVGDRQAELPLEYEDHTVQVNDIKSSPSLLDDIVGQRLTSLQTGPNAPSTFCRRI